MDLKSRLRIGLAVVVLLSILPTAAGYASSLGPTERGESPNRYQERAPPRDGITVVATDSNTWLGLESDGPRANAELLAYAPNGSLLYENDSHTRYWDVDPVPGTAATVEYVASDHLNTSACGGEDACTRNLVERVNLSTGETTRVYSRVTPGKHSTRWHDVDRIGPERLLVADIAQDRVYLVNTSTGLVEWAWDAQAHYDLSSGGEYPSDWTHLNDVEELPDGRIAVSLRNQDSVVFLDRETGVVESWTLGSDDAHDVLYEQHNPDYIPERNGGPALLVADSENNRVVEYQRRDGSWEQTWSWRDSRLQWPRDADRLPDGHTLVTDSNGNRVVEVAENGTVVWSVEVAFPYEAERLGTGDESAGGPATGGDGAQNGSATHDAGSGDSTGGGDAGRFASFDGPYVNAVAYVLPIWMGALELASLALFCLTAFAWAVLELRWTSRTVSLRNPVEVRSKR